MIEPSSRRALGAAIAARLVRQIGWKTAATARRLICEAAAELARLNRAGLDADALTAKSRRARARLVTAALSDRHDGHNRCC